MIRYFNVRRDVGEQSILVTCGYSEEEALEFARAESQAHPGSVVRVFQLLWSVHTNEKRETTETAEGP